jgi:V8-like Glu-specific endopeptidase
MTPLCTTNSGRCPGDSGAAVYRNIGINSYVVAIHTSASSNQNRGVRITKPVFANIQHWANMHA